MADPSTSPILVWRSGDLSVINSTPEIEKYLTYSHKAMEQGSDFKRRVTYTTTNLFEVVSESPRTIITFQGLMRDILKRHPECEVRDEREPMPHPQLMKIRHLRGGQYPLLLQLLATNESGILRAPTRYGKTSIMAAVLCAYPGVKSVVAAPGVDLLGMLVDDLRRILPGREVLGIFSGSRNKEQSEDITVCSFDSLDHIDPMSTRLLLIDEPHAVAAPSRIPKVSKYKRARIYGFGATVSGRFDSADKVIRGLIGPVLAGTLPTRSWSTPTSGSTPPSGT